MAQAKFIEKEPAKVTLELTVKEALHIACLLGASSTPDVASYHGPEVNNMQMFTQVRTAVEAAGASYSYNAISQGARYHHI